MEQAVKGTAVKQKTLRPASDRRAELYFANAKPLRPHLRNNNNAYDRRMDRAEAKIAFNYIGKLQHICGLFADAKNHHLV
jgi:hypothetical protein